MSRVPGLVPDFLALRAIFFLAGARSRSIVEALMATSFSRTWSLSDSSLWCSRMGTTSRRKGANRLPHIPSRIAQTRVRAQMTSGPYTGFLPAFFMGLRLRLWTGLPAALRALAAYDRLKPVSWDS